MENKAWSPFWVFLVVAILLFQGHSSSENYENLDSKICYECNFLEEKIKELKTKYEELETKIDDIEFKLRWK